ncbi:MAG: hypothetical protein K6T29_03750 [Peptococcaceae bacterium]|nr:hypothetical protein [Peptococcaceae bacterium]
MAIFRLVDNIKFYFRYLASGFASGGSWKLNRITRLDSREIRKILVRNMSTYEELFSHREKLQH